MKKLIFSLLFLSPILTLFAQPFEGIIEFKRATNIDTTWFVYYVKGHMVRIDELGFDKKVEGIMIVNTSDYTTKSLSPERQLFMDMDSPNKSFVKVQDVKVDKGKRTKVISGYKCEEWVVSKKDQNVVVTYYITKENFDFFEGLIIALNRKEKVSTFYQQIPDTKKAFPFYAVEADINGKPKTSLEVVSVTKKILDNSLFQIPPGYKRFEK